MGRFVRIGLLGGLFFLVLWPASVPAQSSSPLKEPPKEATQIGEGRLTMESLKAILEGLAYEEVKELKDKDGKLTGYQVKRIEGTWAFYGKFELSSDQSQLWISMNGPQITDASTIPHQVLLDMLVLNDEIWPTYFTYSKTSKRIYIYLPLANKGLKAKDLRSNFETLCAKLKTHEGLWNPKKWATEKPPEGSKDK